MLPETFAQFANLQHISPRPPKKKAAAPSSNPSGRKASDTNWSIDQTLREADRVPSACSHVNSPQRPNWIQGSRAGVAAQASAWHLQARQSNGKAWPKTSPSLASAVISFPRERIREWPAYREAAMLHFNTTYGSRVVGAVEHLDEAHPHIHVYLVPQPDEDFGAVHPGYRASRAERTKTNKVRTAWVAAMKLWQDTLYESFGRAHGLARLGPKRARVERSAWRTLDTAKKEARKREEAAEVYARDLVEAAQRNAQALKTREEALGLLERRLAEREAALNARARAHATRHKELVQMAVAVREREQMVAAMPVSKLLAQHENDKVALNSMTKELDKLRLQLRAHEESATSKSRSTFMAARTPPRPTPNN